MVYVKDEAGKLYTLQEIAIQFNVPLGLVQGRWNSGKKDLSELIKPKWAKWDEEE